VTLDIRTEVSSVVDPTSRFPTVRTREATTRVRVRDGQPLIIGGLIQEEERERLAGIPYLNELPLLGSLFGRRMNESVQTETLIILVPHIIADGIPGEEDAPGTAPGVVRAGDAYGVGAANGPGGAAGASGSSSLAGTGVADVLGAALARFDRVQDRTSVSVGPLSLSRWAAELQLEREKGRYSYVSRLYGAEGLAEHGAWSAGAGLRYYLADDEPAPFVRSWVDAAVEYAVPVDGEPAVVYSAGAGLRLTLSENALVELFGRHQEASRDGALAGLPGRSATRTFGVKLGWRY